VHAQEFDTFLQDALTNPEHSPERRLRLLAGWEGGPSARACHPREEHLLPLHVVAGAANGGAGRVIYGDDLLGVKVSCYQFDD
jgi:aromatic ring-opening dioxygenase catalytic subunit (LigB family)